MLQSIVHPTPTRRQEAPYVTMTKTQWLAFANGALVALTGEDPSGPALQWAETTETYFWRGYQFQTGLLSQAA